MNPDQLNSLVRSVLKIAGAILVARGASQAAALVNTEDVAGVIVSLVGLWLSHKHHAQPATSDGGTHQSAATPAPSSLRHPPSSLPPSASIPTDTVVPRATAAPIQPLAAPKHSDGGSALPVLRSSSEAGSL